MSVKLDLKKANLDWLTLERENDNVELSDEITHYEEYFPEITLQTDEKGRVIYFDVDLWAGPSLLDTIISYFEKHPVPGRYTVEELGVYDAPFTEVLKAVKKYYEEKLKVRA